MLQELVKFCSWKGYLFTEEDKIYTEAGFSFTKHPRCSAPAAGILCGHAIAGLSCGGVPVNHFNTRRRRLCCLQTQPWDVSKKRGREEQYEQMLLQNTCNFFLLWSQRTKIALGQLSWGLPSPLPQTARVHPIFWGSVGQQLSKDTRGHSNCETCHGWEGCASCPSANASHSHILLLPLPWAMFTPGINLFLASGSSFKPSNLMVVTWGQFSCLQPAHLLPYPSLNLRRDAGVRQPPPSWLAMGEWQDLPTSWSITLSEQDCFLSRYPEHCFPLSSFISASFPPSLSLLILSRCQIYPTVILSYINTYKICLAFIVTVWIICVHLI